MDEEKLISNYFSIEEVAEKFSLDELFTLAKQKNLSEWLETNFYDTESQQISDAIENKVSDSELKLIICKIFNLDFDALSANELDEMSEVVSNDQSRKLLLDGHENDERKFAVVKSQGELVKALRDGAEVIYLCDGEFRIPHNRNGKTYIGRNNAIIDFTLDGDIDFDERDIIFEDVQIFLHNPVTLRIEKSKNVKIIDGSRKTLGDRPTLKEIFEIMRGRNSFESEEIFTKRAEDIRGVAVGMVLLKDENYSIEKQTFELKPNWNFDYVSIMKDYSDRKNFALQISPEDAMKLYANERKLQIFADFTVKNGKLTILKLYFETATLRRIFIESVLEKILSDDDSEIILSSGSGMALGYGLELITDYEEIENDVGNKKTKTTVTCPECNGRGRTGLFDLYTCSKCNGKGFVEVEAV